MEAIFSRVSVRKFEDRPVEPEKIEKILRAAMAAPSAKNQQPWEFYVVTNRETLLQLSKATPYSMCVKNTPQALVLAARKEGLNAPEFRDIDLAIATENILLEIETLGLGAVMIGIAPIAASMEKVRVAVSIPDSLDPFTIVPFGYPAKRKDWEDRYDEKRVHWIK
ncbi:MAG: nitroreductase family protein [Schwartzia sp.]|nr:nitroreductase family protein [Schwartzia sp. (in: firmicutes)]